MKLSRWSRTKSVVSRVKLAADRIGGVVIYGPADSIDRSRPSRDLFGLRHTLLPVVRAGLRIANGLGQHLAQLSLCLRWFPRERCLPVSHKHYVGMREGELNPTGEAKIRGQQSSPTGCLRIIHVHFKAISGLRSDIPPCPFRARQTCDAALTSKGEPREEAGRRWLFNSNLIIADQSAVHRIRGSKEPREITGVLPGRFRHRYL